MTVHYSQSCCHDEDETWCGWPSGSVANGQYVPPPAGRYSRDLAEVDCEACFLAVAAEARRVDMRHRAVRRARGCCPVLAHAADCSCDGSAGDR